MLDIMTVCEYHDDETILHWSTGGVRVFL